MTNIRTSTSQEPASSVLSGEAVRRPEIAPRPRRRIAPIADPKPAEPPDERVAPKPKRLRGHATRNEDGKWQPTRDTGFAAPPPQHRFQKGNKLGKGRPRKPADSHDAMVRDEFERKRPVRINGEIVEETSKKLLFASMMADAIKGKRDARQILYAEHVRLYPGSSDSEPSSAAAIEPPLSSSEATVLELFEAQIRRKIERERASEDGDRPSDGNGDDSG